MKQWYAVYVFLYYFFLNWNMPGVNELSSNSCNTECKIMAYTREVACDCCSVRHRFQILCFKSLAPGGFDYSFQFCKFQTNFNE